MTAPFSGAARRNESEPRSIGASKALVVLLTAAAAAGAFLVIEGLASCLLIVDELVLHAQPTLTERIHCRYDEVIGWVQLPDLDFEDMYGPGVFLRTNARGFRGSRDVGVEVPEGRIRIVCSGDSFTLGYGVNDDQAWCQILTTLDGRLETVNMGQGGYGVDQAYLWYLRDGKPLRHQAQILAVNTVDFQRMGSDDFVGYGRPKLELVDGVLAVTNAPIPRRGYYFPWLTQNAKSLAELRSIQLLLKIVHKVAPGSRGRSAVDTQAVSVRVFSDLHAINESKGSGLVVVYLPLPSDYDRGESDPWRAWLRAEAARQRIPFVDLVEELRMLPRSEWQELFSLRSGHFSVAGNQRIAELIVKRLDDVLERP